MRKIIFRTVLLCAAFSLTLSGCSVSDSISKYNPFKKAAPAAVQPETPAVNNIEAPVSPQVNETPVIPETPAVIPAALPLAKADAFKGVVKIKTLALDSDGGLIDYAEGSGVVISPDGFLLTNSHVVTVEDDLDKSDKNAVYGVCFTADMNKEPDCSHAAELILKDKDLDIALLRLNNASSLPFLGLAASSTASSSDEVFALGYPGIGQDTITMTKGIVSGKLDKYGKKWIKTDAVISFGSSGGAAIDKNGQVLGITTAGYSDTLGELGYIIDSASIFGWIKKAEAEYKPAVFNSLTERALKFLAKQEALKTTNVFTNSYPDVSITHPDGWDFRYNSENSLQIFSKTEEDKSGSVQFEFYKYPHLLSDGDILPIFKKDLDGLGILPIIKINKEQAVDINGLKGKKFIISAGGQTENFYIFPWREYDIEISYSYGENDKDKALVDGIINSLRAKENRGPFSEVFAYQSADPVFGINSIKGWPLMAQMEKSQPVLMKNKNIKGAFIRIFLSRKDEATKGLTAEELLENAIQTNDQRNQQGAVLDFENKIISKDAKLKINNEFSSAIKMESAFQKLSTKEVLFQTMSYSIDLNSQYLLVASLVVYDKDKKVYGAAVADFNKIVASLTANSKVDSDNDGLSDGEEIKLGTDPKNPDTDGDGYTDGSEVVNGYNPLGK
jgi:S1-C subfamily serine protease